ncbi:MAG: hypothetical protein V1734_05900 [Nanoarchaeota archaeon]
MKMKKSIKSGLAAILAAVSMSAAEARAEDFERDNVIAVEAGLQDTNLQNDYDFTEGWQIGLKGEGAIDIYNGMQLALGGGAELALLTYSDGCGYDRNISIDASILLEWAPRWDSAAFNLGAGVQFNFMGDYAGYENVRIESQIIGAGPALEAFVGSEWVYAGLNFSTAFGGMGNNVQQHNGLVQYNLGLKLGFHFGPVDIEGYANGMYNTAMEGQINRENVFVNAGANAKVWVAENLGLTAGYNYLWTYGDTDRVDGNEFNAGLAVRF